MNTCQILFALLRMQICGADMSEMIRKELTPQMLKEVYSLALEHDMAHLAGQALSELGYLGEDETSQKLKKQAMLAVYRHARMEHEYQRICAALEECKVAYLPLKGAVLRNFYPEPWMRPSCDIDILVKKECVDRAVLALTDKLGYRKGERFSYDVSLYSPSGVHLELHFDVQERKEKAVAQKIWDDASSQEGLYRQKMSDAMFYWYHIFHMAKHMEDGGCGIKPFLDLWILNHRVECDRQNCENLLAESGLLKFAKAAEKLAEVWFSGAQVDSLTTQLEMFILTGGVYGSLKNSVAVKHNKTGGMLGFAIYKIFLPYDVIKYHYPVLQKHKWLLPICQMRRWGRLICSGKVGNYIKAVNEDAGTDTQTRAAMQQMMKDLGL